MSLSFEDVKKAKKELESILMLDENVVSIGTVREENGLGQETGQYLIQIGLLKSNPEIAGKIQSEAQAVLTKYREAQPMAHGVDADNVSVMVVEEGEIKALSPELPSSDDSDILSAGAANKDRSRPMAGGVSVGHPKVTAGTLGGFVSFNNDDEKVYILSNNHVLAHVNAAQENDPILQPGKHDGGDVASDGVAKLRWFQKIEPSSAGSNASNEIDAAIAEVDDLKEVNSTVRSIGQPDGIKGASVGMEVEKSGRTTGHTYGKVLSVDETTRVNMGKFSAVFRDQIATTAMSEPGDSGSLLFEKQSRQVIGLLFSGSKTKTYHNHATVVKTQLDKAGFFGMRFPVKRPPSSKFSTTPAFFSPPSQNKQLLQKAAAYAPKLFRLIPK